MTISSKLPQDIQHIARKKLVMLDAATQLNDLRTPPGNRLEAVKKSLESDYPRPETSALRPIHGFATAISKTSQAAEPYGPDLAQRARIFVSH